jgi:hypothetical protein
MKKLVTMTMTALCLSGTLSAQSLKLEGHLPQEFQISAGITFHPGVKAQDLSIFRRNKCFHYNTIDFGEGRNFQWIPQFRMVDVRDTSRGNGYQLSIPLTSPQDPECKYTFSNAGLHITSTRTPYRPQALILARYNPNNPAHRKVALNRTKVICQLENEIERCRVTPQHVEGDTRTMLIHEDTAQTFRLDIEAR